MKRGDKVMVFGKPLTQEEPEGWATLLTRAQHRNTDNLETWEVHFIGDDAGDTYTRTIKSPSGG